VTERALSAAQKFELVRRAASAYVTASTFGRTTWPFRLRWLPGARSDPSKHRRTRFGRALARPRAELQL